DKAGVSRQLSLGAVRRHYDARELSGLADADLGRVVADAATGKLERPAAARRHVRQRNVRQRTCGRGLVRSIRFGASAVQGVVASELLDLQTRDAGRAHGTEAGNRARP